MMEVVEDVKVKVYEILDQQPSTFILEGTEQTANPVHLSAAALSRIPNSSMRRRKNPKKGESPWERIRYIKNCTTISVEEQIRQGYEPNLAAGSDDIYFPGGKLLVPLDVEPQLAEYLDDCAMNISNPERKETGTPLFKELKEEEDIKIGIDDFFSHQNVMDYLQALAIKEGDVYKFNTEKIDNLCALFKISGFDPSQYMQKFNALVKVALAEPKEFLLKVVDRYAEKKSQVLMGLSLGVIGWEDNKLRLTNGGAVIAEVSATGEKEKLDEAVNHLLKGSSYQEDTLLALQIKAARDTQLVLKN